MFNIFLLILFSLLLFILLFKLLKNKFNYIISLLISFLILYIVLNPTPSINGVFEGFNIFIKSIFPVMFPFMVCCNFLIYNNTLNLYSKYLGFFISKPFALNPNCSFPILASYISGYPIGAKYSTLLFEEKKITHLDLKRVIYIASNAGPLFLIASVGTIMLQNTYYGYLLLIPSYLSTIFMGLISYKNFKAPILNSNQIKDTKKNSYQFGEAIKKSIEDAMFTLIVLAGYIIFFCVLINIIRTSTIYNYFLLFISSITKISSDFLNAFFLGFIELSNGCQIISNSNLNLVVKLCFISFLGSFGGCSILAQTFSFLSKYKISASKYLFLKFIQGIISALIMYFLCIILNLR
ncbi:MAG: sporulation integral membrane protein YlbJ [Sarcina sp.]